MKGLVTVGIPTYNRPEGLRRTLQSITSQTYGNLQIIIGDNCSPNPEVRRVVDEFTRTDPRIEYYRHETNKGPNYNFQFLLQKAEGEYFMWAADDDLKELTFVEDLMAVIGSHSAAFCNYSVRYEGSGTIEHIRISKSAQGETKYLQAKNFLMERLPSMFYGLYKTDDIRWYSDMVEIFDWLDCYIIFKIILLFEGYAFSDKELYSAGIQGISYQYKPARPDEKRVFTYFPYFKHSIKIILQSRITSWQKIKLGIRLAKTTFISFLGIEKGRKSHRYYSFLYRVYSQLRPTVSISKNEEL